MSGLASKIAGDWFDIREAASGIDRLQDILLSDTTFARQQQRKLLLSVEEGTVEYKRAVVLQTFALLEQANYRTFESSDYRQVELRFQFLTFLTLLQRKIANGTLPPQDRDHQKRADIPPRPTPEIREIMRDIQARVRSDPANRRLPQVKNILMQIHKYSGEVDALKKLIRTAPEDKKPAYVRNFRKTSDEIFAKIKRQYGELLEEERRSIEEPEDNPLDREDLKPLAPLFTAQAEAFASVSSSVVYARTEADKIREAVVAVSKRKNEILSLVSGEESAYERIAPGAGSELARAFARELAAALDRSL